jgi:RND family efflux transporter MFP subunit
MTEQQGEHDRAPRHASLMGRSQIALVIAVVIGALAVNQLLSMTAADAPEIVPAGSAPAVAVIRPAAGRATIRVSETGTVEARANVSITPQVSGRVVRVSPRFAAGGAFRAGEVLFEIDPTDVRLAVQQAQADLAAATSILRLEEAEAATAQQEWRLVNGTEPIPALVAREPQIAQARAGVQAAQARLADVETDLARTRYSLPFDGRIVRATAEVGQTVAANQVYGEAYRTRSVEVRVSLPAEAVAALQPLVGRPARVSGSGPGAAQSAQATVARVDAQLDRQTRLAGVTLVFDGPHPFLPGAFVSVEILGDEVEDVFRLPTDMVATDGSVWVVEGGVLAARRVRVISRQGDTAIVARFDTAAGVVTTPPPGARAGMAVRVVDDPKPARTTPGIGGR